MAGSIYIPIITAFNGKGVAQATGSLKGLAGVAKSLKGNLIAAAVSFATFGAFDFVKNSVTQAKRLESAGIGMEGVFKKLNPVMQDFATNSSQIGLSTLDSSRALTFLGASLKGNGLSLEDASDKTRQLVRLSADLAATYGRDVPETLTALGAVFRGEYDPIEKYGVAIKQAQVNALLASRGQRQLTGSALAAAASQARFDLIMTASQDTMGNYAKMSDTLFVAQTNLKASFENMKASIGQALLGPLSKLMLALEPIVAQVGPLLAPSFELLGKLVEKLTPLFMPLFDAFSAIWEALMPLNELFLELIGPLLPPLVSIIQVLAKVIKLLTPLITFLAKVISAILVPVLTVLGLALTIVFKIIGKFIDALSSIPFIGDFFKSANAALDDFVKGFDDLNKKLNENTDSNEKVKKSFESGYNYTNVDRTNSKVSATSTAMKKVASSMDDVIKKAKSVQESLLNSFDITSVLQDNANEITKSVVYVDGKFQTVISNVSKGSNDIVATFASKLSKLKDFYRKLNQLTNLGLNAGLREQLINAGPEAGAATADAIIASGKEGVSSLNKTFAGLKSLAGTIGAKSALEMSKAGDDIGNGLIDALKAQRDRLVNQANVIGSAVGKALAKSTVTGYKAISNNGDMSIPGANVFNASAIAGVTNASQVPLSYIQSHPISEKSAFQITNPFDAATQSKQFQLFQRNLNQARAYNISINVQAGASNGMIGRALVSAINEYESVKGKAWRNG